MLPYLIEKKDIVRDHVSRWYYNYGLFCSTRPIFMILFSVVVIILCSLPVISLPIFEKILAFFFQRIQINYQTKISTSSLKTIHNNNNVFAYVQQININTSIVGHSSLSNEEILQNVLQLPVIKNLQLQLTNPVEVSNGLCLKLYRDPPSMKALKKRIKYSRGRFHDDLKFHEFYNLDCLHVSPMNIFHYKKSMLHLDDYSIPFQELMVGYPMHLFHEDLIKENLTRYVSFMFTLFLRNPDPSLTQKIKKIMDDEQIIGTVDVHHLGYKIDYQFSKDSGPAELLPLTIAYIVVFFYLWFSVAKLDLIRTRWGLAFTAVVNFLFSFIMAIGICATLDALPNQSNVREIFPYVVILIGIENFWIITKSVMTIKKDIKVKDRVALGLAMEGWYITKNLFVEISLLGVGYISGVKGVQEFSIFALACYLSDFFLQMTFFTPILAVDARRVEVGLPFTDRSAWKYAFYIDSKKPETKKMIEQPQGGLSNAVRIAFSIARYRILQRTVMVAIVIYFVLTVYLPIQEIVSPIQSKSQHTVNKNISADHMSCLSAYDAYRSTNVKSWLFLCAKHWPELLNYYFEHLHEKSLFVLPQIDIELTRDANTLQPIALDLNDGLFLNNFLTYLQQTSKRWIAICVIVLLTGLYKLLSILQTFFNQLCNKTDIYLCKQIDLIVPTGKRFPYKITKMIVDETDSLVCSYNNGSVYVWDLHHVSCGYYINRRTKNVYNIGIPRSLSTYSLPSCEDANVHQQQISNHELPRAVWSLAYKSDVLIVGCDKGSVEIYSLENEALQCYHQCENVSGVVSVQIISCLRFVVAHKSGTVEFCHLKAKQVGHKRTSSLPNATYASRKVEVSRCVVLSHYNILFMQIAIDKIFVAPQQSQIKVLRASDDGGIPLQSNMTRDEKITALRVEMSPEMAIVGTSVGNVYVLNSVGQVIQLLSCGDDEVISISSDDNYIAVLAFDGVLTVWLKEGYIKWWQVNLLSYDGTYELLSLARYSLAAISKDKVVILNIVSRVIVSSVMYNKKPTANLIMASPVVCQNKTSLVIPSGSSIAYLRFPKLIDRGR